MTILEKMGQKQIEGKVLGCCATRKVPSGCGGHSWGRCDEAKSEETRSRWPNFEGVGTLALNVSKGGWEMLRFVESNAMDKC